MNSIFLIETDNSKEILGKSGFSIGFRLDGEASDTKEVKDYKLVLKTE